MVKHMDKHIHKLNKENPDNINSYDSDDCAGMILKSHKIILNGPHNEQNNSITLSSSYNLF